jgi:apolipoprotein D and lipocalin family protein
VESTGKAKTVGDPDRGQLKVSFFGPFWSEYNVIAVDPHYRHALVAGKNKKYLWILSREKILPESVKAEYLQKARDAGYNPDELTWIAHDKD